MLPRRDRAADGLVVRVVAFGGAVTTAGLLWVASSVEADEIDVLRGARNPACQHRRLALLSLPQQKNTVSA